MNVMFLILEVFVLARPTHLFMLSAYWFHRSMSRKFLFCKCCKTIFLNTMAFVTWKF